MVYGVCAAALGAASVISGASLVPPTKDIPLFLALAAVPTICGHTLFNWTLRHLPASVVSTAFLGEPWEHRYLRGLFSLKFRHRPRCSGAASSSLDSF